MRRVPVVLAAGLLASAIIAFGPPRAASAADPTAVIEINKTPLPVFESADTSTLVEHIEESKLAGLPLPWPIFDQSDTGMYLVEIEGKRVWVIDTTVTVDDVAGGSAFTPEAMNMADPDLAGSRGYGD